MKKLYLMLLIFISCSLSAQDQREVGTVSAFDFLKVSQANNASSLFKKIKGDRAISSQSCEQVCLLEFSSCISSAQGTGAWWYCELTFERCMVGCGY